MQRIDTTNKALNLFGAGKHGYKAGVPGTADRPTYMSDAAMNALQEEICNVVEYTGAALVPATNTQLRSAILLMMKSRSYCMKADGGATGDGVTNDTAAVNAALALGISIHVEEGDYLVDNLSWTASNRKLIALGRVRFIKRSNGAILTISGNSNTLEGIEFWGDAAAPVFTGDNLVISGNSNTLINCGSRWASGRALICTGNHLNIIGTCDVYQTADATAAGYDIEIGTATATLYHRITDIRSSQATGGIKLLNTGTASIKGSQFGKLTADKGAASPGNHGPFVNGCRINGAIDIQQSNTLIDTSSSSANLNIGAALSGVTIGDSFTMASGTTVTVGANLTGSDLDVLGKLEDSGVTVTIDATSLVGPNSIGITEKTFAAAISAGGGAPAIGNGTLTMYYSRRGRRYMCSFRFTFGSTTNMGTGTFYISLPAAPRNLIAKLGSAQVLDSGTAFFVAAVQALPDGTARMSFTTHGAASQVTSLVPMAWAVGDEIQGSVEFDV